MTDRLDRAIEAGHKNRYGEKYPVTPLDRRHAQALIADLLDGMDGVKDHKEAAGYDAAINAIKVRAGLAKESDDVD